jgi:hypothetical protein
VIESLVGRGVPLAEIRTALPRRRAFRVLNGALTEPAAVRAALADSDPSIELARYFTDHPLVDPAADETYVLFKMWGRNSERTLTSLSAGFPAAAVTFRAADRNE